MTIILFLVDTSASMNQRTFLGTTLLDVTKNSIETFQKVNKNLSFFTEIDFKKSYIYDYGNIGIHSIFNA